MKEASEMLILQPDDTFYPKRAGSRAFGGKRASRYQDDKVSRGKTPNKTILPSLPSITSQKKGSSIFIKNELSEDAYTQ